MLVNYLKTAFRNILRNKVHSLLNVFGLALGIAACFFIFQYIHFEKSYDRFNSKINDLYRVTLKYTGSLDNVELSAINNPGVGPAMKADFPEVENFTRLVNIKLFGNATALSYTPANGTVRSYNEDNVFVTDSTFFNVFSYKLIAGDRSKCLAELMTIVISQSTATKYFGKEDPIGKAMLANGRIPLKVSAVFEDVPENSHVKFDILVSFNSLFAQQRLDETWNWPEFYVYVSLRPGTDPKKVEAKFPPFIEKYAGDDMKRLGYGANMFLQPVADIHLKSNLLSEAETNGSEREVLFLSIIGVFILIIAWINYVNLSTAKSMERAKEVGLRKVIGAGKSQLVVQFLFESVIISVFAMFAAALIILASIPFFADFIGKDISKGFFSTGLGSEPGFWILSILLFVLGSLLVGLYPSLVVSSFRPAAVLKGLIAKSAMGLSLRRVLVSFQFVLSIILISATLIVSRQLSFMRTGDPGFDKEQVLLVKTPAIRDSLLRNRHTQFKSEVMKIPSAVNIAVTSDIPGSIIRYRNSVRRENEDAKSNFTSSLLEIDHNFVPTYGIKLLAGRNFNKDEHMDFERQTARVLVNEVLMKSLGYTDPNSLVGRNIVFVLGDFVFKSEVIGVMKNFHQRSFREPIEPILCYSPLFSDWKYFSIKLQTKDIQKTISSIEKQYTASFPGNPFQHFFLDEHFNTQYKGDVRLGRVFGLFCILAVVVACLGLVGLTSYVVKLKVKEIGIRKVLGASVANILLLFSKDFLKLVVIASLVAIPIIYFVADRWLTNYAFHISLSWLMLLTPVLLLLAIALLTTSLQALRAASKNPTESLRAE